MLFAALFSLSMSVSPEDFYINAFIPCPEQEVQYFSIKKFQVYHPFFSHGLPMTITLVAELSQKVQEPYLEIQLLNHRIPLIRKKDLLCRPGILICPASFSQLVYGATVPIPTTIPYGDYQLRLVFKEGIEHISCYETKIHIKKLEIPEEPVEEVSYEGEYDDQELF